MKALQKYIDEKENAGNLQAAILVAKGPEVLLEKNLRLCGC